MSFFIEDYRRRISGKYLEAEGRVNCMASRHTILIKKGALIFPNHPNGFEEIEVLQVMDADIRCRCQEVLFWWTWYTKNLDPGQILEYHNLETGDRYNNMRRLYAAFGFAEESLSHRVSYYDDVSDSLLLSLIPKPLQSEAQEARQIGVNRMRERSCRQGVGVVSHRKEERPKFLQDPRMYNLWERTRETTDRYSSHWRKKELFGQMTRKRIKTLLHRARNNMEEKRGGGGGGFTVQSFRTLPDDLHGWIKMSNHFGKEGMWFRECCEMGFIPLMVPDVNIWPNDFPPAARGLLLRLTHDNLYRLHEDAWATLSRGKFGEPLRIQTSILSHP